MDHRQSLVALPLVAALSMSVVGAQEQSERSQIYWITTPDSVLLQNSTKALQHGRHGAGIRYASRALQRSPSAVHQRIANHNLCVAWHLRGETATAARYCAAARQESADVRLREIGPGVYEVDSSAGESALAAVMQHNLDLLLPSQIVQTNTPANRGQAN